MGFRREIKIRFLIFMVVALILGGCLSDKMLLSRQDTDGYNRGQHSVWMQEHPSLSHREQGRNSLVELKSGRDDGDAIFHANRLMKNVFLDGQGHILTFLEELGMVPFHQASRRQQDAQPDWTDRPLDDEIFSRLSAMTFFISLLHWSALAAMIHQLTSTRKGSLKSKWNKDGICFDILYPGSSDRMTHTVNNRQSKDIKKQSWLEDPLRWAGQFDEYTTYSVLERVASFRPFAFDLRPNIPSAVSLAQAGFQYPGVGSAVQCQGCRNLVEIARFISPATEANYHREGCYFVTVCSSERIYEGSQTLDERAVDLPPFADDDGATANFSDTSKTTSLGTLSSGTIGDDQSKIHPVEQGNVTTSPDTTSRRNPQAALVSEIEHDSAEPLEQNSEHMTAAENLTTFSTASCECQQIGQVPADSSLEENESATREHQRISQVPASSRQQGNEAVSREHEQTNQVPAGPGQQTNASVSRQQEQVSTGQEHQENATSEIRGAFANPVDSELLEPEMAFAFMRLLFEPNTFDTEAERVPPGNQDPRETCQKNPGHFGSFPMAHLHQNHIPSNIRCPEMLTFFQKIGKLVVKLTIKKTSTNRPQFGEPVQSFEQYGTGLAFVEDDSEDPAPNEPTRKWSTIKRYLPGFKKSKGIINIRTSRHVIFDDFEAENTLVEFFYDNPDGNGIVKAKGVSVTHSSVVGDATTVLKCTISDLSMVEFVKNTQKEVCNLVAGLPQRIKAGLTKRVFVISHPHGLEKMFSYGEYAIVKYALKPEKRNGQPAPEIVKINNHTQISENSNSIRKMLFYTADTCKGSSGGLVISFKKIMLNGTEDTHPDLWIHSCVEKKHGLNASVMKELTQDDITNHGSTSIIRPSVQDEQEEEADAAARRVVSGPVYTVMGPPAHPVYVPYMKRLHSYPNEFPHVHTAADLADAGFFFAGYADCVRCFQCGLGLRSWKAGDNIYEEHHRNRPDCQFLQMKMRANGIHWPARQSDRQHSNDRTQAQAQIIQQPEMRNQLNGQSHMPLATPESSEEATEEATETQLLKHSNGSSAAAQQVPGRMSTSAGSNNENDAKDIPKSTAVKVLEKEQKYLKQIFTCKICFEKPVKDLFLPCGELVACLECSKLLTHCPSCNKKILATVTTYFS